MNFFKYIVIVLPSVIALFGLIGQTDDKEKTGKKWYRIASPVQWTLIGLTIVLGILNVIQAANTENDLTISKAKVDSLRSKLDIIVSRTAQHTKLDSLAMYYNIALDLKKPGFNRLLSFLDKAAIDKKMSLRINDSMVLLNFDLLKDLDKKVDEEMYLHYMLTNFEIQIVLSKSNSFKEAYKKIPDCGFEFKGRYQFDKFTRYTKGIIFNPQTKELILEGTTTYERKHACNKNYLSEEDIPGSVFFIDPPSVLEGYFKVRTLAFINGQDEGVRIGLHRSGEDGIPGLHGMIASTAEWQKQW